MNSDAKNEGKEHALWAYVNPQYVSKIASDGSIYYTDEFYDILTEKISAQGLSPVKAFTELGFNMSMLSEARAHCAATRATKRKEKKSPFEGNIADYDSSKTFEQLMISYSKGEIAKEELYANMAARLVYLEEMNTAVKKKISQYKPEPEK